MFTDLSNRWWLLSVTTLLLAGLETDRSTAQNAVLRDQPRRFYALAILVEDKAPPAKTPSAEDQKKLQALLTERRDVLKEVFEKKWKRLKDGLAALSESDLPVASPGLLDVSQVLLQAELELTDKADDRIAAHEKYFTLAKETDAVLEKQVKDKLIRREACLKFHAARLAAEIDLLREKAGGKPNEEQTAAIKKLLEARRDTLREEAEAKESRVMRGLDDSHRLLQAELELTEKTDDRLALLEKQLALSKEIEKIIQSQADAGRVRSDVVDELKAWRSLDEIALLREKAGAKPNAEQSAEIRKLLGERREALERLVEAKLGRFQAGLEAAYAYPALLDALRLHLQSELELLDKPSDRVAVHQNQVERVKKIEERLKKQSDNGKIRVDEYLQGKAARLEAEIGLLREQLK
jgi:hypothetical protein